MQPTATYRPGGWRVILNLHALNSRLIWSLLFPNNRLITVFNQKFKFSKWQCPNQTSFPSRIHILLE